MKLHILRKLRFDRIENHKETGQNFVKFIFSKKPSGINPNLRVSFTLGKCQSVFWEILSNFCGLLREHELCNHKIVVNLFFTNRICSTLK